jgi:hypothetical protein
LSQPTVGHGRQTPQMCSVIGNGLTTATTAWGWGGTVGMIEIGIISRNKRGYEPRTCRSSCPQPCGTDRRLFSVHLFHIGN